MEKVTLCATKAGKGYKIVVNDKWFYTSIEALHAVMRGESKSCTFKPIEENAE